MWICDYISGGQKNSNYYIYGALRSMLRMSSPANALSSYAEIDLGGHEVITKIALHNRWCREGWLYCCPCASCLLLLTHKTDHRYVHGHPFSCIKLTMVTWLATKTVVEVNHQPHGAHSPWVNYSWVEDKIRERSIKLICTARI